MESETAEHLDPTNEITLDSVKKRTFLLSLLSLVATGLLTVFLDPSEFGIFWIVSAVVNFLAYFSDVGMAAALIQKKDELKQEDITTSFTVQAGISSTIFIVVVLSIGWFASFFKLNTDAQMLLLVLIFTIFLSFIATFGLAALFSGRTFYMSAYSVADKNVFNRQEYCLKPVLSIVLPFHPWDYSLCP